MSSQFLFIFHVNEDSKILVIDFFFMQRIERRVNLHLYALNVLHSWFMSLSVTPALSLNWAASRHIALMCTPLWMDLTGLRKNMQRKSRHR